MNQHLDVFLRADGKGVIGLEHLDDCPVKRSDQPVALRLDSDAVTRDLLGEDHVGHVLYRQDLA